VAGVGNIFLGDDGFGVEVVRRLASRSLPQGVRVADFGIRGFDLAMALLEPQDLVVIVDAARRGQAPGTLYLLKPEAGPAAPAAVEAHGMVPAQVLGTVRSMGGSLENVVLVACEPETFGEPGAGAMGLSAPVDAAVEDAIGMIESLLARSAPDA
jgi:hydrogenase maturation protease